RTSQNEELGAVAKVWSSWVESAFAAASGVRVTVAVQLEPKTGLALATTDGACFHVFLLSSASDRASPAPAPRLASGNSYWDTSKQSKPKSMQQDKNNKYPCWGAWRGERRNGRGRETIAMASCEKSTRPHDVSAHHSTSHGGSRWQQLGGKAAERVPPFAPIGEEAATRTRARGPGGSRVVHAEAAVVFLLLIAGAGWGGGGRERERDYLELWSAGGEYRWPDERGK
ncbi:hypothetical protein ACJX0J_040379, partial [Zea mays]